MLRILDANLNRIGEGLRVLEDISRFVLNDVELSQQLKSLRHDLLPKAPTFREKLLGARQAGDDVGAFADEDSEGARADAGSLVSANSRRVQQSLRVLEEMAKLPDQALGLDWESLKQARFSLYELEQRIVLRLLRGDRMAKMAGLYLVIDPQALGGRSEIEVAGQAIEGGARVVQLRDKTRPKSTVLAVAQELRQVCVAGDALFIANDDLDVALGTDADGLHVGQDDLPVDLARKLLPVDRIVGCSTATLAEALEAQKQGADYIAVGAIYDTPSKPGTRVAGIETLRRVKAEVSVPVVAIGGINEDNVAEVVNAGASAVAVISAVLGAEDVREASQRLAAIIGEG